MSTTQLPTPNHRPLATLKCHSSVSRLCFVLATLEFVALGLGFVGFGATLLEACERGPGFSAQGVGIREARAELPERVEADGFCDPPSPDGGQFRLGALQARGVNQALEVLRERRCQSWSSASTSVNNLFIASSLMTGSINEQNRGFASASRCDSDGSSAPSNCRLRALCNS